MPTHKNGAVANLDTMMNFVSGLESAHDADIGFEFPVHPPLRGRPCTRMQPPGRTREAGRPGGQVRYSDVQVDELALVVLHFDGCCEFARGNVLGRVLREVVR